MPSAATVLEQLALDQGWEVVEADDVPRSATGPEGQSAELLDSVVQLLRTG